MKIFAKRKKTALTGSASATAATGADETSPTRSKHASDPAVQALLQKNPSEWNAKERRMVKRHQDRKGVETTNTGDSAQPSGQEAAGENSTDMRVEACEQHFEAPEPEETATKDGENNDNSSVQLEDVLDASLVVKMNSKQRRRLCRMLINGTVAEVQEEASKMVASSGQPVTTNATSDKPNNDDRPTQDNTAGTSEMTEVEQVKKLLDGLNSKQKRTLSRKVDRGGDDVLTEVRKEAEALLRAGSKSDAPDKQPAENADNKNKNADAAGKTRKRRRGGTSDLSSLTAEERLRREEQRRRQKEAAERRAIVQEESSGRKHPLNSERRRANRRKPKWTRKADSDQLKAEHNASGFDARHTKKERV